MGSGGWDRGRGAGEPPEGIRTWVTSQPQPATEAAVGGGDFMLLSVGQPVTVTALTPTKHVATQTGVVLPQSQGAAVEQASP